MKTKKAECKLGRLSSMANLPYPCGSVGPKMPGGNYRCTRPEGHTGMHHAHDMQDDCRRRWRQMKARPFTRTMLPNVRGLPTGAMTMENTIDEHGIHRTKFAGLGFLQLRPGLWRVVNTDKEGERPAVIGPLYRTREELLADLPRYAFDVWGLV